jgi:hypothetical protein
MLLETQDIRKVGRTAPKKAKKRNTNRWEMGGGSRKPEGAGGGANYTRRQQEGSSGLLLEESRKHFERDENLLSRSSSGRHINKLDSSLVSAVFLQ